MPRVVLTLLFVLLQLSSCKQETKTNQNLRIAIHPWPGYEFIYLAKYKGFFEGEGINVDVIELGSIGDAKRALDKNQVDIMPMTNIEILEARDSIHKGMQIFYMLDFSNGGDVIISHPDIDEVKKLKGKRIAVEANTLNVYMLHRALKKNGLSEQDVEIVKMDQSRMEQAYKKKEIDAVVTFPPFSTKMQKNGMIKIFSSAEIPNEIIDFIAAKKEYIDKNQELLVKFVLAHEKALQFYLDNPNEAVKIMANREGISPEDFSYAIKNDLKIIPMQEQRKYFSKTGLINKSMYLSEAFMLKEKLLKQSNTVEFHNDTILKEALKNK